MKKYDPQDVKIGILQKQFRCESKNIPKLLETELKSLPSVDFLCSCEHTVKFPLIKGDPRKNSLILKLSKIAVTYDTNLILCGFPESVDDKVFFSCLFLSRSGKIFWHRKKDNSRLTFQGTDDGVFPSEYGNIGILICVEIEDHVIRESCLKHKPVMIFNPALIVANEVQKKPNFKVSSESISTKLEKYSVDHNTFIIRVDHPFPRGMASSQVICPDHTFYWQSNRSATMVYRVNLANEKNFQSALTLRPPYTIRSYHIDNVGNRYRTHTINDARKPIEEMRLVDPMMFIATKTRNRVSITNFNTFKEKVGLSRTIKTSQFPQHSTLLASKRNNVISVFGNGGKARKNENDSTAITIWDLRRGSLILDREDLSLGRGRFQRFMSFGGSFLSFNPKKREISFFHKNDLKLEHSILLGPPKDNVCLKELLDQEFLTEHQLLTKSEDMKTIQEWDLRFPKSPVKDIVRHDQQIDIMKRMKSGRIFFTDLSGNLWKLDSDEDTLECVVKEFPLGIKSFVPFDTEGHDKVFLVDRKNGSMSLVDGGKVVYSFLQDSDIQQMEFNGKTKIFTCGKEFLRVFQFQQNRSNIHLGDLLK